LPHRQSLGTRKHIYIERRMTPLNLYLNGADDAQLAEGIRQYGEAIRELAGGHIFPGDMLYKNFGVTRQGRVVFYDYDESCARPASTDRSGSAGRRGCLADRGPPSRGRRPQRLGRPGGPGLYSVRPQMLSVMKQDPLFRAAHDQSPAQAAGGAALSPPDALTLAGLRALLPLLLP
jgi:hypothetical protein